MSVPPLLLSLDCATLPASVALLDGTGLLCETAQDDERRADAWLGLAVEHCLDEIGVDVGDLAGVAVCVGPGTFTGIRVGIATALGLAAPSALPVAGVTSLDALALIGTRHADIVAACIDARRDQVYAALYVASRGVADADEAAAGDSPFAAVWGPEVCSPRHFGAAIAAQSAPVLALGSGAALLGAGGAGPTALTAGGELRLITDPVPLAGAVGELAMASWPAVGKPPDWPAPEPVYLRPPDATPPRNPLLAVDD
ncbi:MAG: tRNA (adenosine(37)-N6)-threonylcarbamoyltransferase complex dimerization subunit type 1 TsaB [Acidobacteriota bacterium]|jgi:tRNA threonylcarbamoyl adenosine modification protein YeaZ